MNNERRRELRVVCTRLEDALQHLECVLSDEQDAFDNLPEGIQMSERGETMEDGISTLEDACSGIEDVMNSIEELIG